MSPIQLSLRVRHRDDATFANFMPGANAAALASVHQLCAARASWTTESVYLWGGREVGRSHLLQAACVAVQEQGDLAMYVPLRQLISHGPRILDDLERSELVCLDDLDAAMGYQVWEEALFHLFNRLRDSGRRLLISARVAPRELPVRLADLHSRISQALVYQLQPLTDAEKISALRMRAIQRGLQMPDDVVQYIHSHGPRSLAALFSGLDELDQASLQAKRRLTVPFLKKTLGW